jgi:hypothetical protein
MCFYSPVNVGNDEAHVILPILLILLSNYSTLDILGKYEIEGKNAISQLVKQLSLFRRIINNGMNQQSIVSFLLHKNIPACGTIDLNLNCINTLRHKYMYSMSNTIVHKNKIAQFIYSKQIGQIGPKWARV